MFQSNYIYAKRSTVLCTDRNTTVAAKRTIIGSSTKLKHCTHPDKVINDILDRIKKRMEAGVEWVNEPPTVITSGEHYIRKQFGLNVKVNSGVYPRSTANTLEYRKEVTRRNCVIVVVDDDCDLCVTGENTVVVVCNGKLTIGNSTARNTEIIAVCSSIAKNFSGNVYPLMNKDLTALLNQYATAYDSYIAMYERCELLEKILTAINGVTPAKVVKGALTNVIPANLLGALRPMTTYDAVGADVGATGDGTAGATGDGTAGSVGGTGDGTTGTDNSRYGVTATITLTDSVWYFIANDEANGSYNWQVEHNASGWKLTVGKANKTYGGKPGVYTLDKPTGDSTTNVARIDVYAEYTDMIAIVVTRNNNTGYTVQITNLGLLNVMPFSSKVLQDQITANYDSIDALNTYVNALKTNVNALNTDVAALQSGSGGSTTDLTTLVLAEIDKLDINSTILAVTTAMTNIVAVIAINGADQSNSFTFVGSGTMVRVGVDNLNRATMFDILEVYKKLLDADDRKHKAYVSESGLGYLLYDPASGADITISTDDDIETREIHRIQLVIDMEDGTTPDFGLWKDDTVKRFGKSYYPIADVVCRTFSKGTIETVTYAPTMKYRSATGEVVDYTTSDGINNGDDGVYKDGVGEYDWFNHGGDTQMLYDLPLPKIRNRIKAIVAKENPTAAEVAEALRLAATPFNTSKHSNQEYVNDIGDLLVQLADRVETSSPSVNSLYDYITANISGSIYGSGINLINNYNQLSDFIADNLESFYVSHETDNDGFTITTRLSFIEAYLLMMVSTEDWNTNKGQFIENVKELSKLLDIKPEITDNTTFNEAKDRFESILNTYKDTVKGIELMNYAFSIKLFEDASKSVTHWKVSKGLPYYRRQHYGMVAYAPDINQIDNTNNIPALFYSPDTCRALAAAGHIITGNTVKRTQSNYEPLQSGSVLLCGRKIIKYGRFLDLGIDDGKYVDATGVYNINVVNGYASITFKGVPTFNTMPESYTTNNTITVNNFVSDRTIYYNHATLELTDTNVFKIKPIGTFELTFGPHVYVKKIILNNITQYTFECMLHILESDVKYRIKKVIVLSQQSNDNDNDLLNGKIYNGQTNFSFSWNAGLELSVSYVYDTITEESHYYSADSESNVKSYIDLLTAALGDGDINTALIDLYKISLYTAIVNNTEEKFKFVNNNLVYENITFNKDLIFGNIIPSSITIGNVYYITKSTTPPVVTANTQV